MLTGLRRSRAALLGAFLVVAVLGCGGGGEGEGDGGTEPAAGTEAGGAALDGEWMEPRIVVEHPIDAPGRPRDGAGVAVAPAAPAVAWVPHLTVSDLDAALDFYRGAGFSIASREGGDGAASRVELERDGARLVLVARAAEEGDEAGAAASTEGGEPAPAEPAPPVLHLVEEGGGPSSTVSDPDGHRLALPDGR
ncbi:MAG TPA: hypothetical protein VHM02_16315 [Thermoanaerobaculia bacterium]|nr:hypothetical protein [Thermoanaerobaculia bacterium]